MYFIFLISGLNTLRNKAYIYTLMRGCIEERTSSDQMMFTHIYVPHVEEPAMKGYMSSRDTFSGVLVFP